MLIQATNSFCNNVFRTQHSRLQRSSQFDDLKAVSNHAFERMVERGVSNTLRDFELQDVTVCFSNRTMVTVWRNPFVLNKHRLEEEVFAKRVRGRRAKKARLKRPRKKKAKRKKK